MQSLKRLFDFYINSSIHVALAVSSLTYVTVLEFHLKLDINIIFFVFFATVTGYNFVKYFGLAKFHHRSLAIWLKQIQMFSLLSFLVLIYYAFKLEVRTLLYILVLGFVTFLYAIPFLPKSIFLDKGKNLRAISGLKVYVIALVWSITTVILPLVNQEYPTESDGLLTAVQRYLYVLVAMLPFEIRDLQFDSIKLSTIPQQIGIKATKVVGAILLFLIYILEYFKTNTTEKQHYILLFIVIVMLLFVLFSKVNQKKYYSSFAVESIPIIWVLLIVLFC